MVKLTVPELNPERASDGLVPNVLFVVLIPPLIFCNIVVLPPPGANSPQTSQSPAVSEIDVIVLDVFVTRDTALPDVMTELIYSPTLPAAALSLVVVPTIPPVVGLNVIEDVVNAGSVELMLGTPPDDVTNTPLLAVAKPTIVLLALEYRS